MIKKLVSPWVLKPFKTINIMKNHILNLKENMSYYLKDILNLINSFSQSYLSRTIKDGKMIRRMNGIKFLSDFNIDPQFFDMFLGFYEISVRNVLLRYLKKGDVFLDIGANLG